MKSSTTTQFASLAIVVAGLAFESLDVERYIALTGIFVFWIGVGMERSNNDKK